MLQSVARGGELKRWVPWITAIVLLLAAVIVQISMEGTCWDQESSSAAKINESAGCFEFWFNRYQTMIAGVFAAIAAYIAFRAARYAQAQANSAQEQVREARLQTGAAMMQSYIDSFEFFSRRRNQLIEIKGLLANLMRVATYFPIGADYKAEFNLYRTYMAAIKNAVDELEARASTFSWLNYTNVDAIIRDANNINVYMQDTLKTIETYRAMGKHPPGENLYKGYIKAVCHNYAAVDDVNNEITIVNDEIKDISAIIFKKKTTLQH